MAVARPDPVSEEAPRPDSIEALFAALESPLLSYALRFLGDRALAEDVVQEAFMKLHVEFEEVREPRRWLYRTVHNLALNQQRQSRKIVPLGSSLSSTGGEGQGEGASDIGADPEPLPDEQIIRWEGIGLVRLSLSALDERSRELVRLKFEEELSYKQISEKTNLTVSHVGYLLHHALKTIADELTRAGLLP